MNEISTLPSRQDSCLESLTHTVGNTPLLALEYRFRGRSQVLFAKCEQMNMTGSIKDRMALHILRIAYRSGALKPGDVIAEATSGNTGISFAALGRALGHQVIIFMPDWMSEERRSLLRSYGAELVLVTKERGGFVGAIELAKEFASKRPNVFFPDQFSNNANVEAHEISTGPELDSQLRSIGVQIEAFVAGVGTGGTVMGVGRYLRQRYPRVRVHPIEPAESPTLSKGKRTGTHRIQGISDEFVPAIVELDQLDEIIAVPDGDSILMSQALASKLGLGVGISSGCNFIGAVKIQEAIGGGAVVATVFPDDNKKYLSTDLMRTEPSKSDYLSTEIELCGARFVAR